MKSFKIKVTKVVEESAIIHVPASSEEAAHDEVSRALDLVGFDSLRFEGGICRKLREMLIERA